MTDDIDQCELLDLASSGDRQALAELFELYRRRLKQTVRLRMDSRMLGRLDASDVLQEAFLDAARRLPEYVAAPNISLFLWLRSLTTQRLVDLHRHHLGAKMRSVALEVSLHTSEGQYASAESLAKFLVDSSRTPGAKLIHLETKRRVQDALNAMEPIDREVLAMRHFESLTNGEVADVLSISKAAASNRYVRALQRLHGVLHGIDDQQ